jgi:hypothetical protein
MSEPLECPLCKGELVIEEGILDQTYVPMKATVYTCQGSNKSYFGCGYKSWRPKVNEIKEI